MIKNRINKIVSAPIPIAPLAVFRFLFGFIMLISIIRFAANGWINDQYIAPHYYFTYYGFDWVQPLGAAGMYILFSLMGLAAMGIMAGCFYRIAAPLFFLLFTYVELIDKTNYLNHYYFVSLVSFLLILVPAHRSFSLDVLRNPQLRVDKVPAWTINIFKLQLGLVYFFAGIAKLNYDWLFNAMPLQMWLPAHSHLPLIGEWLKYSETAYIFSWAGAIYDLSITFLLLNRRMRIWAYLAVICFHMITWWFFQIGMFPFIMILSTLIFFSPSFHQTFIRYMNRTGLTFYNIYQRIRRQFWGKTKKELASPTHHSRQNESHNYLLPNGLKQGIYVFLGVYFVLQLLLPFRYTLYPGNLFWNEEGYRFSWRVMLMEKAGTATFTVKDKDTGRSWLVSNWEYLTPAQEKMMATQPDMILQFAHYLEQIYHQKGVERVEVTVRSHVTLNGSPGKPLIEPRVDLSEKERGWAHKTWILPYNASKSFANR